MNRSLVIPAVCCMVAFVGFVAALHAGADQKVSEPAPAEYPSQAAAKYASTGLTTSGSGSTRPISDVRLTAIDAEKALADVAGEYLRPWREWESSPRRLYSRAAIRPIPSMVATVDMSPTANEQHDSVFMAAVVISSRGQSQSVPCVVDRISKRAWFFADGKWLSREQWLAKAPKPQ